MHKFMVRIEHNQTGLRSKWDSYTEIYPFSPDHIHSQNPILSFGLHRFPCNRPMVDSWFVFSVIIILIPIPAKDTREATMIRAWTPATLCSAPTPTTVAAKPKPMAKAPPPVPLSRRHGLSVGFTSLALSLFAKCSRAAILEADDDEELLERVKKDRKKRLQRQGVISSSDKETGSSFLTPPFAELAIQIVLLLLSNLYLWPCFMTLFKPSKQWSSVGRVLGGYLQ